MKITYISTENPQDIHSWSGLTHYIAKSLVDAGNDLAYIHSLKTKTPFLIRLKQKTYPKLFKKFIQANRYSSVYKQYKHQIEKAFAAIPETDFIFSNSTETIAVLNTHIPIAIWVDASFAGMLGYYSAFDILHPESIKKANELEQKAYDKASVIFFASDWAAQTALKNYHILPQKVKVVPFGANISNGINPSKLQLLLQKKSKKVCKLLFIGVDWKRKGGPLTVKVAQQLISAGIPTELTVVGCNPFDVEDCPEFVIQKGFLSKKIKAEADALIKLYQQSHFFILPTQAECYGLVYAEANAYGLPAIGTKTGGVPTIIKNDENGKIFDLNADADDYIAFIKSYFLDSKAYESLAMSSLKAYHERLNWEIAGQTVSQILLEHC